MWVVIEYDIVGIIRVCGPFFSEAEASSVAPSLCAQSTSLFPRDYVVSQVQGVEL